MDLRRKKIIWSFTYAIVGIGIGLVVSQVFMEPALQYFLKTPERVTALEQRLEYVAHLQEEEIALRRLSKKSGAQKTTSCHFYILRYVQRNQAVPESIGTECGLEYKSPQAQADELSNEVLGHLAKEENRGDKQSACSYFIQFYKDNGLVETPTMLIECAK